MYTAQRAPLRTQHSNLRAVWKLFSLDLIGLHFAEIGGENQSIFLEGLPGFSKHWQSCI